MKGTEDSTRLTTRPKRLAGQIHARYPTKKITTWSNVVVLDNRQRCCYSLQHERKPFVNERHIVSENAFVEMVVWRLPSPLSGSSHDFKYRLAFVVDGRCVLHYDNEAGKGDHKHKGEEEIPYIFTTPQALLDDFWNDVDNWRH